jgi:hypothetical protein
VQVKITSVSLKSSYKKLQMIFGLSWLLEWPECQRSVGLSKLVSVTGIRKDHKVTNLENLVQAAIQ